VNYLLSLSFSRAAGEGFEFGFELSFEAFVASNGYLEPCLKISQKIAHIPKNEIERIQRL
jgi:hypothetical protein